MPTFEQQMEYITWEWDNEAVAKSHKSELNGATTPEQAAYIVRKYFERPGEKEADDTVRKTKAREYLENSATTITNKETIKQNNKDIYEGFLNAVKKSLASTNSNVQLTYDKYYKDNTSLKGIIQSDGKNEKLDLVFDIILNGYYEYVQQLRWVANENEDDFKGKPIRIEVSVSEKVDSKSRVITVVHKDKENDDSGKKFGNATSNFNESLLKSIYKKYKNATDAERNEIKQFDNFDIFTDIEVKSCDTLISNGNLQSPSEVSPSDKGMIDGWDVGKACAHLISNAKSSSIKACARYVEEAIAAGGGPLKEKISCGAEGNYATNLRYNGILESKGFVKIDDGTVQGYGDARIKLQSGDVAIIGADAQKHGSKFHACMYCSQGWISDFKQKHMSPYSGTWPYAIYRYKNKMKT